MAGNKDPDYLLEYDKSDSSGEDGPDTDDETVVLNAVNSIIRRSLKRTRGQSKAQKAKRTKRVRDRRQGRILVDKDVGKPKSRYCASYLVEIMKSFDEEQRQHIKDIDFGGILELDGGFVPWSFVQWLAEHVNVSNEEIDFDQKSIPISVESFGHVLGVPTEGDTVPSESKFATAVFLEYFGLSEMPTIKFFGDKILKKGQNKEEFVICFMTVALATFFCPTSSTKPSTAYLGGITDVDKIKSYNWGKYFHQWTLWYIKKYLTSSSTLALCNYYIAVRYLDFLDFGSVQIQSSLPRIKVWKGDMIKDYIKWDMDDDNYYGKLQIKDIMDTCYGQVTLTRTTPNDFSAEELRKSIDSFQHSAFNVKVTDTICTLFEKFTQDETSTNCSKVQDLLISVLKSLIEHNCIPSSSQSTEKLFCSSQGENKSSSSNKASDNTLKMPSSGTSSNIEKNQDNPDTAHDSQHSDNSVPLPKTQEKPTIDTSINQVEENIATTDQIIAKLVDHTNGNDQLNLKGNTMDNTISGSKVADDIDDSVNAALCNLNIKEKDGQLDMLHIASKGQVKHTTTTDISCGNSASLEHLLKDETDATSVVNFDDQTSPDLLNVELKTKNSGVDLIRTENVTPEKTHAMFAGIHSMGMQDSDSMLHNFTTFNNNSSIQCGQRTRVSLNQSRTGVNLNSRFSECSANPDSSSETRFQSHSSSQGYEGLDNMAIDDFEVDDGQPSISFMDSLLAAPRNQAIRNAKNRQAKAQEAGTKHDLVPLLTYHAATPPTSPSPKKVIYVGSTTSPQRSNSVASPVSPPRNTGKEAIIISSQESPEDVFHRQNRGRPGRMLDDSEVVYIGEHRLSPIRTNITEAIDMMYDQDNDGRPQNYGSSTSSTQLSNTLPARRVVMPSRFVSSPYDVYTRSFTPSPKQVEYYQAMVRLANTEETRYKMAIQIGTCKVSFDTFGNSLKPGGVVEAWVINLYCRILFKNNHPRDSDRHTFFHIPAEYFLEKWTTERKRIELKEQTMKAFEGAGKAKKLHLTESLHFPSVYNHHWFLFTVDIRDKKFMFMDSMFAKDSSFHREVDERMTKNFQLTWDECNLKKVNFDEFETIHVIVPKQNNGKDCGVHLMKNITLFKPRNNMMGTYSHLDMPNIRIQIANDMMFSEFNESKEMQQAVRDFKPTVHGRYARMM